MISTFILIIFIQGGTALARSLFPFLPTSEGVTVSELVSRSLTDLNDNKNGRKPRELVSDLSLLWPQIVGPIEDGIIKEESFDAVPKTTLEHKLDDIRAESKIESATRQHVRNMLNHGIPPSDIGYHQLYALHQDMAMFLGDHHLHQPLQHHPNLLHHGFGHHPPTEQAMVFLHNGPHQGYLPSHRQVRKSDEEQYATSTPTIPS